MKEKKAPTIRDPEDRFQRDARTIIERLSASPLLQGQAVTATFGADPVKLDHALGRAPTGFFIIDATEHVTLKRVGDGSRNRLTLQSSAPATLTIWVF